MAGAASKMSKLKSHQWKNKLTYCALMGVTGIKKIELVKKNAENLPDSLDLVTHSPGGRVLQIYGDSWELIMRCEGFN